MPVKEKKNVIDCPYSYIYKYVFFCINNMPGFKKILYLAEDFVGLFEHFFILTCDKSALPFLF